MVDTGHPWCLELESASPSPTSRKSIVKPTDVKLSVLFEKIMPPTPLSTEYLSLFGLDPILPSS